MQNRVILIACVLAGFLWAPYVTAKERGAQEERAAQIVASNCAIHTTQDEYLKKVTEIETDDVWISDLTNGAGDWIRIGFGFRGMRDNAYYHLNSKETVCGSKNWRSLGRKFHKVAGNVDFFAERGVTADALSAEGHWQQVENKANCAVWSSDPRPNATVTWTGACVNGKAEGHGRLEWRFFSGGEWKEDSYTGAMLDGKNHGRGVFVFASGHRYEGDFRNGKWHGRGVFMSASGNRYEGDFRDSKFNGHGVLVAATGTRYEGDWKDGKKYGRGVDLFADGNRYEGDFENNKWHGRGVYVSSDGSRYEGDFRDSRFHGRGVFAWVDGDRYEGDWRDGKKHGRGVFVFANGNECEGDWRENRLLGTGEGLENGEFKNCFDDGGTIVFAD